MGVPRDCRDVALLRATVARGVLKADLAHHVGVTPSTLHGWLSGACRPNDNREAGTHEGWHGWTAALIAELARLRDDGMTKAMIGQRLGCGKGAVSGKLRRMRGSEPAVRANT